ncbi:hypothetical protein WG947_09605 [Pontibacter sp. H259]|uniref:hypothetical protein n=1 Tax=Pontibacter sp. H259 TaxID=3133421 RepID=UPI0030C00F9B
MAMKLYLLIIYFTPLNSEQPTGSEITGKWLYQGTVNKNNQTTCCVECPDLIELSNNGTYKVYNDCYATDPRNPQVETGKWQLVASSEKLILKERKFLANHYFLSPKKLIDLTVVSVDSKQLRIRYDQVKTEQYNRAD